MEIFSATTKHVNNFKALFDILFLNLTTTTLHIEKEHILIHDVSDNQLIFNCKLPRQNFEAYTFNSPHPIQFGVGAHNSHDFKSIKAKSTLTIKVTQPVSSVDPYVLVILASYQMRNFVSSFTICTENIQNITPTITTPLGNPTLVSTQDFNSLCRAFKTGILYTQHKNGQLTITSEIVGIKKKVFIFGIYDAADKQAASHEIQADKFLRLHKIASFSNKTVAIYISATRLTIVGQGMLGELIVTVLI